MPLMYSPVLCPYKRNKVFAHCSKQVSPFEGGGATPAGLLKLGVIAKHFSSVRKAPEVGGEVPSVFQAFHKDVRFARGVSLARANFDIFCGTLCPKKCPRPFLGPKNQHPEIVPAGLILGGFACPRMCLHTFMSMHFEAPEMRAAGRLGLPFQSPELRPTTGQF